MNKIAFFTLPIIGSFVYLFLNIFSRFYAVFKRMEDINFYEYIQYSCIDFIFYFLRCYFIDTFWFFGILSLILHYRNIHFVNKVNIILLIVIITIFSIIVAFIPENPALFLDDLLPITRIVINILWIIFYLSIHAFLVYYLIQLSEKYFIKTQQPFMLTDKNSSNIHFILFSTFISFILLKGYGIILITFNLMDIRISSELLNCVYIAGVFLAICLSKASFKRYYDKIQIDELIKSLFVSSIIIFIGIVIDFYFMFTRPYNPFFKETLFVNLGRNLLFFISIALIICFVMKKTTKCYFQKKM